MFSVSVSVYCELGIDILIFREQEIHHTLLTAKDVYRRFLDPPYTAKDVYRRFLDPLKPQECFELKISSWGLYG